MARWEGEIEGKVSRWIGNDVWLRGEGDQSGGRVDWNDLGKRRIREHE